MSDQAADDRYWAAQPKPVQSLRNFPLDEDGGFNGRLSEAYSLAFSGYLIDAPIMVWGWSPSVVMQLRQTYGYVWVPSILMHSIPLSQGGLAAYTSLPIPFGGIKVVQP